MANLNDLKKPQHDKQNPNVQKKSFFEKFIDGVERVGNKLPHPFWLFVSLSLIIMALSFAMSKMGVEVTYLKAARSASDAPAMATVAINNLLSQDSLRAFFTDFTGTYSGFAPLGLVMIMMLGVGMLEQTVISLLLPYAIAYLVGLSLLFVIWLALSLPVGF